MALSKHIGLPPLERGENNNLIRFKSEEDLLPPTLQESNALEITKKGPEARDNLRTVVWLDAVTLWLTRSEIVVVIACVFYVL